MDQHPNSWGFRGRRLTGWDWGLATCAALGYLLVLMSTTDMGFTRDESFYFHHSKVYMNWFTRLTRAESPEERRLVLGRDEVFDTWKNNSEHPPMMKVLFGLSWRFLGAKKRPVSVSGEQLLVKELGLSHGFEKGDRVSLLAPVLVGGSAEAAPRRLGWLEVAERRKQDAVVTWQGGQDLSVEEVRSLCGSPEGVEDAGTVLVGCEAETRQLMQVLSESDAFRFPGGVMGALLVWLLFLFGVQMGGTWVALAAVLMMAFIPRWFFHAHLTCFDVPVTAMSFLVLYGFVRSLNSTGWAVATGFFWGLALLTKLNAFFLPITLLLWWILANRQRIRFVGDWTVALPAFPKAFVLMPLVGLPMLFLLWPWLWYDSIDHLGQYMGFHLTHEHYFQYYFGQAYQAPPFPWSLPFVLTLITVPVMVTFFFLVGGVREFLLPFVAWMSGRRTDGIREDIRAALLPKGTTGVAVDLPEPTTLEAGFGRGMDRPGGRRLFVFLHVAFPIVLIALPSTPVFGGVKHWFPAMPFYCLTAAVALVALLRVSLTRVVPGGDAWASWGRGAAALMLVMLMVAPGVRDSFVYCRYGTAYYNELIGGLPGAAQRRLQRQFWSFASREAMDFVNRVAPADCRVDFQDATTGTCDMLKDEGLMRHDLKCASRIHAPSVLLFDVEERFSEEEQRYWRQMGTVGPMHEVSVDGVPLVRVYVKGGGLRWLEEWLSGQGDQP